MKPSPPRARTPVAPPEEDPNVEVREYASPACFAHELDGAWLGPLTGEELGGLLHGLLAEANALAEFASSCADGTAREQPLLASELRRQAHDAHDCAHRLSAALGRLDQPHSPTRASSLHRRALGAGYADERLVLLLHVQAALAQRLRTALPRVDDAQIRDALAAALSLQEQGFERLQALLRNR